MIEELERKGWSLGPEEGDEVIREEDEMKSGEDEAEKEKMRVKRGEVLRLLRAKVVRNVRQVYSK